MSILDKLQKQVTDWRESNYPCTKYPAISEIIRYNKDENGLLRYLRQAQFNALETYWYIRIVLKTPHFLDLYKEYFQKSELRKMLSIPHNETITDIIENGEDLFEKIKEDVTFAKSLQADTLHESLQLTYPSYILALAMGAGKTVLIGSIIASEFAMAMEYPEHDFMKNALVFAPGTTIIESLREIAEMPFEKILPARFFNDFIGNIKIVYTRSGEKGIPVLENSNYNLVVTNTEKIMLKKVSKKSSQLQLEEKQAQEQLLANIRLKTIASLPKLGIFSDEAHHTYGNKLGEELKRVRSTINHLASKTNIVCVVNTTGTPYYKKQILKDVIFWYSLQQGIQDNILKSLHKGIITYDFDDTLPEAVIADIIKNFFDNYKNTKLANGSKAKIAFYFAQQNHLDNSKPLIENALIKNNQPATLILTNTQKSSTKEIEEFNRLNDPQNEKRVILLIGKGTEGWNCPSLFATALVRKLTSSNNFVLQAATRCLRQVPENKQRATIYIEAQNQRILNKELQDTFKASLYDIHLLEPETKTQILEIKKETYPPLKITRKIKKVIKTAEQQKEIQLTKPVTIIKEQTLKTISEPNLKTQYFFLTSSGEQTQILFETSSYDLYTATLKIAQNYHLDYLQILQKLKQIYGQNQIPRNHLQALFEQVESQVQNYKIITETITEALAIIKFQDEAQKEVFTKNEKGIYCHTIRYKAGSFGNDNKLLVHKKKFPDAKLGFHYTPYNFDSEPEKDFFEQMFFRLKLKIAQIEDIYFTGGLTGTRQTDMYFQYKGIDGGYHNYFPDFVIVKKDNSFLIVEIKGENQKQDPIVQAKAKAVQELIGIAENHFQYKIIYTGAPLSAEKFLEIEKWIN